MNRGGALVFLGILASAASNPEMKYSFCLQGDLVCEPKYFASNSTFEFGNLSSGLDVRHFDPIMPLSVSCSYHEPLHWILTAYHVNLISKNVTKDGSSLVYYYHIYFLTSAPGLIRCESYDNPDMAAEIYLAKLSNQTTFNRVASYVLHFVPTGWKQGEQLIVPCAFKSFNLNWDTSNIQLRKLNLSDIEMSRVTPECLSCFPHTMEYEADCNTSCPYGISQRVWSDADEPYIRNSTGNEWVSCVKDTECALVTLRRTELSKPDCNEDGLITCSDQFNAVSSYPSKCQIGDQERRNFRTIEACFFEKKGQLLDSTETDYDPRLGFRLKIDREPFGVYACTTASGNTMYLSLLNPINNPPASLYKSDLNTDGIPNGLYCSLPKTTKVKGIFMSCIPCSTLSDCEVQLYHLEGTASFRKSNDSAVSKGRTFIRNVYGSVISMPPGSGIVKCKAWHYLGGIGFSWNLQYFFTGLDSKMYFVSDILPTEAVISLETVRRTLKTSTEFEIQIECTISIFIVFPNFEFLIEHENGTVSNTEQRYRIQQQPIVTETKLQKTSQKLTLLMQYDDSVTSIKCRAPFRHSTEHAEATLQPVFKATTEDPGFTTSSEEAAFTTVSEEPLFIAGTAASSSSTTIGGDEPMAYLPIIVSTASVILITC